MPEYHEILRVAADLIGDECLEAGIDGSEYTRGICELLGDLYGRPGIELGVRKYEVLEELRFIHNHT